MFAYFRSRARAAVLILLLLTTTSAACTPAISREMLTPTATMTNTRLPSRTPDPNSTATSTPRPTRTSTATAAPVQNPAFSLTPEVVTVRGLVIETFPLGPAEGYSLEPEDYNNHQVFYESIPPAILTHLAGLWQANQPQSLEILNARLAPFGYRLTRNPDDAALYDLYQDGQLLHNKITQYGTLQINATGTDFILPVTIDVSEVWILQRNSFLFWFSGRPRFLPIFSGDITTSLSDPVKSAVTGGSEVLVMQDQQAIYSLPVSYEGAQCCPIESFQAWNDGWVLEAEGDVIMNGESLREKHAYSQVFNWQALADKEFFLYQQGSTFGIYFDGLELPYQYDQIVHWPCFDQLGGSGYNFSARGNGWIAGFFAMKDGAWSYVEITPAQ